MNTLALIAAALHAGGILSLLVVIVIALLLAGLTAWVARHFRAPDFVVVLLAVVVFLIVLGVGL